MAISDQDRVIELETRITFLEQSVDELNEIVTRQQQQLALMERALKHLNSRIDQAGGNIKPQDEESPPPHY